MNSGPELSIVLNLIPFFSNFLLQTAMCCSFIIKKNWNYILTLLLCFQWNQDCLNRTRNWNLISYSLLMFICVFFFFMSPFRKSVPGLQRGLKKLDMYRIDRYKVEGHSVQIRWTRCSLTERKKYLARFWKNTLSRTVFFFTSVFIKV